MSGFYDFSVTKRDRSELPMKDFEGFGKGPKALLMSTMLKKIDPDYKNNSEIKWNFTKFLIDREGNVIARFEPTADMKDVRAAVEKLI